MAALNISSHEPSATARPVEPLLASHLIEDEHLDELMASVCNVGLQTKEKNGNKRLQTGVKSLDDALGGGIQSGSVTAVSGEIGTGPSEICCTLLVNSLLQHEGSTAAVVDTTGNFDVLRLYALINAQLSRRPGIIASLRSSFDLAPGASTGDLAAKILDRVKIMRAFDFVGMEEAVNEIMYELGGEGAVEPVIGTEEKKEDVRNEPAVEDKLPTEKVQIKRTYVADSEDEEDDEMLFDSEAIITTAANSGQIVEPARVQHPEPTEVPGNVDMETERSQIKFILIDNLARVFNPLLRKDYIEANALAAAFLSNLSNLTQTHTVYTLLGDPALPPRASSPKRSTLPNQQGPLPQQREPPFPPSIFASNDAVPSLVHLLGRYTDMQVLVSRLPRRKMDARIHYSDTGESGKKRGVEMVGVLEVVSGRWEGRSGAWGTFCEGKDGIGEV